MAENKKSFILYVDIISTFEELKDAEAGRLIKHLLRYVNDLNPVAPDRLTNIAFEPIKVHLKRDLKHWDIIKKDRSNSGKLGNLKRWSPDLYEKVLDKELTIEEAESIAKIAKHRNPIANVANVAVNVNVNDNVIKKEIYKESDFEIFWDLYDKKVGDKEKLKKKWQHLSKQDHEKILEFIPKYKKSQPNKKYRKNPETFLNNKSWNDEIIIENKVQPTNGILSAPPLKRANVD